MTNRHLFLVSLVQSLMIAPMRLDATVLGGKMHLQATRKDMSRVVGQGGETIRAIKTVAASLDIEIKLDEPAETLPSMQVYIVELHELLALYFARIGQPAKIEQQGNELLVRGAQIEPAVEAALASLFFKMAKHRGADCNVRFV